MVFLKPQVRHMPLIKALLAQLRLLLNCAVVANTAIWVLAPNALAIEPVQRVVSPGGIEALLIESHAIGLISLRFSFRGGAIQDPADKPGVAYLTGSMFNEGGAELTSREFMARLARVGASFAGDAGLESVDINFTAPSSQRNEAISLLKMALVSPRFDAEPLERTRRAALASLAREQVNPESIAMRRLMGLLYGPNRYSLPVMGTIDAVARISVNDVRAYRARTFARDTLRVAVAGDIDAAMLGPLLDDLFASLPAKAELRPAPSMKPAVVQHEAIAMDLPQTKVMFGNLAPLLDGREELAASLFNQILSAQFTGRLFNAVREREGLVYSITTGRRRLSQSVVFHGSFGASPLNASRAMATTLKEIDRLITDGPTEQELQDAKAAYRGGYYLGLDTTPNLSAMLMTMLKRNLPDTYLLDLDGQIAGITMQDVRAVARRLVSLDKMASVRIGKPAVSQSIPETP